MKSNSKKLFQSKNLMLAATKVDGNKHSRYNANRAHTSKTTPTFSTIANATIENVFENKFEGMSVRKSNPAFSKTTKSIIKHFRRVRLQEKLTFVKFKQPCSKDARKPCKQMLTFIPVFTMADDAIAVNSLVWETRKKLKKLKKFGAEVLSVPFCIGVAGRLSTMIMKCIRKTGSLIFPYERIYPIQTIN